MKIIAYTIVHYGREWLYWALSSVVDYVDEIHIFYTPFPSHGHGTLLTNPEDVDSIFSTVSSLKKVWWHTCSQRFLHEGMHRQYAVDECVRRGADIILVIDADEIWPGYAVEKAIECVKQRSEHSYRIGMRHFWRSTYWVCDDNAMPTRLIRVKSLSDTEYYLGSDVGKVFHMGYAQSPQIIKYKQDIHGHKAEWRSNWYDEIFMPWSPDNPYGDVHPTNHNYWYPKPINIEESATDYKLLRDLIEDHPYWKVRLITDESFGT